MNMFNFAKMWVSARFKERTTWDGAVLIGGGVAYLVLGPLAEIAAEYPIAYSGIPDLAKVILAGAMVLGRLETLAIIALFNPEIWRN